MIKVRFLPEVYDWLKQESNKLGMSIPAVVCKKITDLYNHSKTN